MIRKKGDRFMAQRTKKATAPPFRKRPKLPSDLTAIPPPPVLRNILALPDLSISVDEKNTTCNSVVFTVTLDPALEGQASGNQAVRVRVIDKVFGVPQTVGEVLLLVPAAGGSTSASIAWPTPPDSTGGQPWSNEITLVVDPDNFVAERDKTNNSITVVGQCIG